ncbi:MAG: regulatory protein RecX [Clostridia bacterium]|nr:regulatory protein RecX [Clostridia bacterium]
MNRIRVSRACGGEGVRIVLPGVIGSEGEGGESGRGAARGGKGKEGSSAYLILADDYISLLPLERYDVKSLCELLSAADERYSALRAGRRLLEYASNTRLGLTNKLRKKGFSKASAEFAAARLCESGFINETEDVRRDVELLIRRGWGRKKIAARLSAKGYSQEAISEARRYLDGVDFTVLLRDVIRKKWGAEGLPEDSEEREKAVGVLCRLGFSLNEISHVLNTED